MEVDMMPTNGHRNSVIQNALMILALDVLMLGCSASKGGNEFELRGMYLEGSDCGEAGAYAFHTAQRGCRGMAVMALNGGKFMNVDLNGAKLAYATETGNWVRIYVEAANPVQREATILFAREYLAPFGTIDSAREASITLTGDEGRYTATVDGGSTLQLSIEPVIGADQRRPIMISNSMNRLSPSLFQARLTRGTLRDGEKDLTIREGNAFFNSDFKSDGKL
jgi:hypothetical protein